MPASSEEDGNEPEELARLPQSARRRALAWLARFWALPPLVLVPCVLVWSTTQPIFPPVLAPGAEVDPVALEARVRALASAPRNYQNTKRLDAIAAELATELRASGAAFVEEQPFVPAGTSAEYRNVIAHFGPDTRERVVVGAHYDAQGPNPGADDNASGVAALLALAPLLARSPLGVRVELVAYTLEEPPYFRTPDMGSARHAARVVERNQSVRAMLSLEMLGFYSDAPGSQRFPSFWLRLLYPSRGNFIAVVGRDEDTSLVRAVKKAMTGATDLPIRSLNGPESLPGVEWSDHRSYWARGFPALMVTDTSLFRNERYHTARDTPETLDYARMAKAVSAVHAAVVVLAR